MPILVVDDKAEIRSLISDVLVDEGYTVAHAANGREALAYLHAAPTLPCIIILDLMMPLMDGWDFLRARQGNPVIWAIPTVVISDLHTFAAANVLGAQECLLKPLDLDCFVALVQRYCDKEPADEACDYPG
jgi:CheY-like chemotaxis protein